jgi:methionine-rich copper-binding protein CopC
VSRLAAGIVSTAALVVAFVMAVTVADAHARLDESTPAVGEVVQTSPPQVSITFSQEVQKIMGTYGIDVLDGTGTEVTVADAVLSDDDRRLLTVELPPDLAAGRYVVEYKNVSDEDGDEFQGAYAFYVGRQPTPEELALDEALVGEEEDATPTAETATTPTASAEETRAAAPTSSTPVDDVDDDDDTGGNITLVLVIAAIVLVALLVTGGFFLLSRRQAG